jgi:HdeA/HdeB family
MKSISGALVTLVSIVVFCVTEGKTEESLGLHDYTCADFLKDVDVSGHGNAFRSLMMIYWATGYASAHAVGNPRADPLAIKLIATTLGNECRKSPRRWFCK